MDYFKSLGWPKYEMEKRDSFFEGEFSMKNFPMLSIATDKLESHLKNKYKGKKQNIRYTHVPGFRVLPKSFNALLTPNQHELALDILYLKPQINHHKSKISAFKFIQTKIELERETYREMAKNKWKHLGKMKLDKMDEHVNELIDSLYSKKIERVKRYQRYYDKLDSIPLKTNYDQVEFKFEFEANLLQKGGVNKMRNLNFIGNKKLNFETEFNYNQRTYAMKENCPCLFEDPVCDDLVQRHIIDVVITASGLKKLAENYENVNATWNIPIRTKLFDFVKANGQKYKTNVVYIDKPLANRGMTNNQKKYWLYKRCVKSYFLDNEFFHKFTNEMKNSEFCKKCDLNKSNNDLKCDCQQSNRNQLRTNVSYMVWVLKSTDVESELMKNPKKPIRILVRSKLDGCNLLNDNYQFFKILPKLEYQLEYGAEIVSKTESIHSLIDLMIRPGATLLRILIDPVDKEFIEKRSLYVKDVYNECIGFYNTHMNDLLALFHNIFSKLLTIASSPGDFLLQHFPKNEAFAVIMKNSLNQNGFDLHDYYKDNKVKSLVELAPWLPIDSNVLLPTHKVLKTLPGLFQGNFHKQKKNKKKQRKVKVLL